MLTGLLRSKEAEGGNYGSVTIGMPSVSSHSHKPTRLRPSRSSSRTASTPMRRPLSSSVAANTASLILASRTMVTAFRGDLTDCRTLNTLRLTFVTRSSGTSRRTALATCKENWSARRGWGTWTYSPRPRKQVGRQAHRIAFVAGGLLPMAAAGARVPMGSRGEPRGRRNPARYA